MKTDLFSPSGFWWLQQVWVSHRFCRNPPWSLAEPGGPEPSLAERSSVRPGGRNQTALRFGTSLLYWSFDKSHIRWWKQSRLHLSVHSAPSWWVSASVLQVHLGPVDRITSHQSPQRPEGGPVPIREHVNEQQPFGFFNNSQTGTTLNCQITTVLVLVTPQWTSHFCYNLEIRVLVLSKSPANALQMDLGDAVLTCCGSCDFWPGVQQPEQTWVTALRPERWHTRSWPADGRSPRDGPDWRPARPASGGSHSKDSSSSSSY